MFFVSEEFLRKYQEGGEAEQTIAEAVPVGQELFEAADVDTEQAPTKRRNTGQSDG